MTYHLWMPVADLRGGAGDAPPPRGSKFFRFHAVFGKFWQNRMLVPPPGELAPPPRGNPGSATGCVPPGEVSTKHPPPPGQTSFAVGNYPASNSPCHRILLLLRFIYIMVHSHLRFIRCELLCVRFA